MQKMIKVTQEAVDVLDKYEGSYTQKILAMSAIIRELKEVKVVYVSTPSDLPTVVRIFPYKGGSTQYQNLSYPVDEQPEVKSLSLGTGQQ